MTRKDWIPENGDKTKQQDMKAKFLWMSVSLALVLLAGCTKQRLSGTDVVFRISSPGPATRTAYSGVDENGAPVGETSQYERIDWSDGDWIGVYCAQASRLYGETSLMADYSVTSHQASSHTVSSAKIAPAGNPNGLQWGSGEHQFLALYPSPNAPVFSAAEKAKLNLDETSFSATVPAAQTLTQRGTEDVWLPQMQYAWMFARTVVPRPQSEVNLSFIPEFTSIEFTISAGENDRVDLTSFTLSTSAAGYALAGDFTVPAGQAETESSFSYANTSQTVTIDFTSLPGGVMTVLQGSPLTFTVLLLPREQKNLSIRFTGTQIGSCSLAISDRAGNTLVFSGRNKYRIYGLSFPKLMHAEGEDIIWDQTASGEGVIWSESASGQRIEWNPGAHGGDVGWNGASGGGSITWD